MRQTWIERAIENSMERLNAKKTAFKVMTLVFDKMQEDCIHYQFFSA